MVPGGRDLDGFFEIFEILGGAGDIHNSTSVPNYRSEAYGGLGNYVKKDPSAWTEVWSGPWPSTAPLTAHRGRDVGDF